MIIKAKKLVDLIIEKNADGIQEFVQIMRKVVRDRLESEEKDLYELSMELKIKYNIIFNYIYGNVDDQICFVDLFKLIIYLNE